jgi:ArsR family transcriptional regulator, virulence genes transcriptional regulator
MIAPTAKDAKNPVSGHLAVGRATAFLKVLAHEGRLEIMCLLLEGDKTVGEIAANLGMSQSTVSQQLMRLRAEGLVIANREGRSIRYSFGRPESGIVVRALQQAFCPPDAPE